MIDPFFWVGVLPTCGFMVLTAIAVVLWPEHQS